MVVTPSGLLLVAVGDPALWAVDPRTGDKRLVAGHEKEYGWMDHVQWSANLDDVEPGHAGPDSHGVNRPAR